MKKLFKTFTLLTILFVILISSIYAIDDPVINKAKYAYLYNISNNQLLYAKNEKHKVFPASTVKLMTAVLALEHLGDDLTEEITVTKEAIEGVGGNNIGLKEGEILTVKDLIYSLIVGGSNDVAGVIAYAVSGGIPQFVKLMNEKASDIGMDNTIYKNPSGLHVDSMYTTANDTAKIALYAYNIKIFTEISSLSMYTIPATNVTSKERRIINKNYFISSTVVSDYYNPEIIGLNAGSTPQAGGCVIAVQIREGSAYLCIVMGADIDDTAIYSYVEAQKLLDWANENYGYVEVLNKSEMICEIPVSMAEKVDHVVLMPEESIELFMPVDIDYSKDIKKSWILYSDSLTAPVEAGEIVGKLQLYYNENMIGEVNLITKSTVDVSQWSHLVLYFFKIVSSFWFKVIAAIAISLITVYIFVVAIIRQRIKDRQKHKRR